MTTQDDEIRKLEEEIELLQNEEIVDLDALIEQNQEDLQDDNGEERSTDWYQKQFEALENEIEDDGDILEVEEFNVGQEIEEEQEEQEEDAGPQLTLIHTPLTHPKRALLGSCGRMGPAEWADYTMKLFAKMREDIDKREAAVNTDENVNATEETEEVKKEDTANGVGADVSTGQEPTGSDEKQEEELDDSTPEDTTTSGNSEPTTKSDDSSEDTKTTDTQEKSSDTPKKMDTSPTAETNDTSEPNANVTPSDTSKMSLKQQSLLIMQQKSQVAKANELEQKRIIEEKQEKAKQAQPKKIPAWKLKMEAQKQARLERDSVERQAREAKFKRELEEKKRKKAAKT